MDKKEFEEKKCLLFGMDKEFVVKQVSYTLQVLQKILNEDKSLGIEEHNNIAMTYVYLAVMFEIETEEK